MEKIGSVLKKEVVEIYCDFCGKGTKDEMGNFECATLSANWGYTSRKDGEIHNCHMCETCYDTIKILLEGLGGYIEIEGVMKEIDYSEQVNIEKGFKDSCGCDGNCEECTKKSDNDL